MELLAHLAVGTAIFFALGYLGAPLWAWALTAAAAMPLLGITWFATVPVVAVLAGLALPPLRRRVLTGPAMRLLRKLEVLPEISATEREAIEAGETWLEKELFSGKPDGRRLADAAYPGLSAEEQAFLDGPVQEVCDLIDDWEVHLRRELSDAVWDLLRRERFFGMIIPAEHGGLGFSPSAHSAVIAKLASRSMPLAVTVMVPNSLGPAELLIHYGTDEQRRHYLPRLARGEDMPCFALTEPEAGSDAGAMLAEGVVFRDDDGQVRIRLSWDKRYITLAGISTVLGLAFKLRDPDDLLGKGKAPGITCALIPTDTPGIDVSRRHDPLGSPFWNCPTTGKDVVVGVDAVIGGVDGVGRGWRMLMECLAAGRGISLPALATGSTKLAARVASAHALVRKQFGMSIGRFEGVEEPLARITGYAWMLEACRRFTCGGLDAGVKPPVVTAMCKYQLTEMARVAVSDAMDVLAGNAISRGPRNLLASVYTAIPICITVEGANILTRTLMVFGQGAFRCHPWAFREIEALAAQDLRAFDRAFAGHLGHVFRNGCRALLLSITRGRLARSPVPGLAAPYYRRLAWASASFAFWADVAMGTLGGELKRKEKLTGRFADALAWMYLAAASLRRFVAEGQREADYPLLRWCMDEAFARVQQAFDGIFGNMQLPFGGTVLLRRLVAPLSRVNRLAAPPSDRRGSEVAQLMLRPGAQRDAVCTGIHMPTRDGEQLLRLERAFELVFQAEELTRKVRAAMRNGQLPRGKPLDALDQAMAQGILTPDQVDAVLRAEQARRDACAVDSFTHAEYRRTALQPAPERPQPAASP